MGKLLDIAMAASGPIGAGINAISSGVQNRKQRKWNEKMYKWSRRDALADWNMQNAYNSPVEQMQRLKAAGLNPNLVYGNGANALEAAPMRAPELKNYHGDVPRFGDVVSSGIVGYLDAKMKSAQIDNLKAANEVTKEDAALRRAQTLSTLVGADSSKFDLGLKQELRDTSVDAAKSSLMKLRQDMDLSLQANERAIALNSVSVMEAVQRIVTSRLQNMKVPFEIDNLRQAYNNAVKDGKLKQLDIDLRKLGLSQSDPAYLRAIGRFINGLDADTQSGVKGAAKGAYEAAKRLGIPLP